jgi:hypothetical protein
LITTSVPHTIGRFCLFCIYPVPPEMIILNINI